MLDLSCRLKGGKYWVVTDRWQKFSELSIDAETLELLSKYCAEFLVHGVDVEGKQCGIDENLIRLLASSSPLPVTYAGGVKDLVSHSLTTGVILSEMHVRMTWSMSLRQVREGWT